MNSQTSSWWRRTPARRAIFVIAYPVWWPARILSLVAWAIIKDMLLVLLWCWPVKLVAWILYGDPYVAGRLWWYGAASDDDRREHRWRTREARDQRDKARRSGPTQF